ncbi:uncharacterized protein JCM15063_004383 [Sporobolomyces koalae]|uniref:uncharacterized protein n=1 Tax=Sporobolomyces koalae TaxID=500713 RepID=UPI00316F0AD1
MLIRSLLLSALPLASLIPSSSALLGINLDLLGLTHLDLDVGLLKNGALVNIDAFANVLGSGDCPSANVGVRAAALGLVKACVCVNLLHNGLLGSEKPCPPCPNGQVTICGGARCACSCDRYSYSDHASKTCLPIEPCVSTGGSLLNYDDGTSSCVCKSPLVSTGNGCALPPSAGARRHRHRRDIASSPHAARPQKIFRPSTSEPLQKPATLSKDVVSGEHCPLDEQACPLSSGGFECVDTKTQLTSCGGCVSQDGEGSGTNCLAIPGALGVECQEGKCVVASCFRGWSYQNGRCV